MVDVYMLDNVLDKIKEITGIEKLDDTEMIARWYYLKKCCDMPYKRRW